MQHETTWPLQPQQRGIWYLENLYPGAGVNNIGFRAWVEGPLESAALCAAVEEFGRRHTALRVAVVVEEDGPVHVLGESSLQLQEHSCVVESEALAHSDEFIRQPFDLTRAPLARIALTRVRTGRHLLTFAAHHVVCDGSSLTLVMSELGALYGENTGKGEGALGICAPSFLEHLPAEPDPQDLAWWRTQLRDISPLQLPTDRPRTHDRDMAADWVPLELTRELTTSLRALARRAKATPFVVVMAAFQTMLHRFTGQTDITIGAPHAGRHRDNRNVIGMYADMLPYRGSVDPDRTFLDFLEATRDQAREVSAHRWVPFPSLVESISSAADLGRTPIFQAALVFQNFPVPLDTLPGLLLKPAPVPTLATRYDLELEFWDGESLSGRLIFSPALHDTATARAFADGFLALLEDAVRAPSTPLSQLAVVPDIVRRTLSSWSAGPRCALPDVSVPELVDAFAQEQPEATALTDGTRRLSYRELVQDADRLAARLAAAGVTRGTRVALCAERSLDVIVAQLGIMKAGAAYVPIDPSFPADRIAFMLDDAEISLVAVQTSLAGRFADSDRDLLLFDATAAPGVDTSGPAPQEQPNPDDLMYVLYTSGTTGRPKGVMVEHRNVIRLVTSPTYADLQGERVLLYCSLAFDVSVFEIWGPLTNGGSVAVPPAHQLSAQELADWVKRLGVTTMWLTAGLFVQVADAGVDLSGVRQLLAGGDVVPPAQCAKILERFPGITLINGYGPTEATTFATSHRITATDLDRNSVPIGRPIGNTTAWVLDARMSPVPPGAPGELYLGGAGVARGYLNRPELTAERFVRDPFATEPDARLYRSGDLVRWRSDGTLEFLGRIDQQVKLRGFRIELEEVEGALVQHPSVQQAAVVAREDLPGDKRLVAYVCGLDPLDAGELSRHAASLLPAYMVPSAVVVLDRMPLTANGKLDRHRLPAPQYTSSAVAPRSELESVLCGLFARVLSVPEIGVRDDFFLLGGHSLLATRLISAVRDTLGVDVPLRTIFEAPTVEALAARVSDGSDHRPPLRAVERRPDRLPVSFAQQRLLFTHELEGPSPLYNIPIAIRLRGAVDQEALEAAFADVVARHESLRTVFGTIGEELCQNILGSPAGHTVLTRAAVTGEELAWRLDAAAHHVFNPFTDLPLRAWLFELNSEQHVLAIVLHHIAGDGWSMSILGHDLSVAYAARCLGRAPDWPPLPLQYADYALWQRALTGSDTVAATQLAYWTEALSGIPVELALPHAEVSGGELPSHLGAHEEISVDVDTWEQLAALADGCEATRFMVLQAAVAALLSSLGAGDDIPLGVPVAGRTEAALEGLVGYFVNTLVLRTDVSGNPTPRDLLSRIRQANLSAYAHQDLPFEQLVEALRPPRSAARHPLFQVMLSYDNNPPAHVSLPGVEATTEELPLRVTKFALQFAFRETAVGGHGGLVGTLKYALDHFAPATAARVAQQLPEVLKALATHPDTPLSALTAFVEPLVITRGPAGAERVPEASAVRVAPRSPLELTIAGAWAEVLGMEEVSVHDNFFDLGGHSLMATRVAGRLRERLIKPVAVRLLFNHQTVASLAEELERRGNEVAQALSPIPLLPRPDEGKYVLPASSGQQQLWFLDQLDPAGGVAYNLPAAFRIDGPLDVAALEGALRFVSGRHEALRTSFATTDNGELRTVVTPDSGTSLSVVELPGAGQATVERLVQAEGRRPFDLTRGPLLRTRLLRLGEQEHVLLVTTHHIVADGWSLSVFTRELAVAYAGIVEGKSPKLEAAPLQFADFAAWQHEQLSSPEIDPQLAYWRKQLDGVAPSALPTDRPRPEQMSFAGATTTFEIDAPLVARVEALGREEDATAFMVSLAAFYSLLNMLGGQEDLVVGTPVAGRTHPETESLIGYFASTLALRTDLSGKPVFRELIRRVRQTCLDGYAHQDVTFERLVEALKPPRDPGRSPIYQVMFAYQNAPGALLELTPEVTLTRLRTARTSSILDLALILREDGEGGLQGSVEYNTSLFDAVTVERLADLYLHLLRAVTTDPDRVAWTPAAAESGRD
ncbi:amino acid adenylation domain-containing protein [Streptomyces sp. NPDC059906]|uniref:amino acid adenylation domain-containing protein n=1 Tax=Streptomyces sp. NPDC059906 TaxID=3346997 RepID=UPI00365C04D2